MRKEMEHKGAPDFIPHSWRERFNPAQVLLVLLAAFACFLIASSILISRSDRPLYIAPSTSSVPIN